MIVSMFTLFLNLGGGEIILILLVVLLLFGGKGVPQFAKALGKGIREFKNASEDLQKDIQTHANSITNTVHEQMQDVTNFDEMNKNETQKRI